MNQQMSNETINSTYLSLRFGLAAIGIAFPIVLWGGGVLLTNIGLQNSMSAYYYTGMRDLFVGILVAVGVFLFFYRGECARESWTLNLAGIAAIGVAFFPVKSSAAELVRTDLFGRVLHPEATSILHGIAAVFFFLCMAYVSLYTQEISLSQVEDKLIRKRYKSYYTWLGRLMLLTPIVALSLEFTRSFVWKDNANKIVFWAELVAIVVFSIYWFVKTREYRHHQQPIVDHLPAVAKV